MASNALVQTNQESYRASTDAAALCREIVVTTAMEIQKRRYVKVEGWQAIAVAHGCAASARDVEKIEGGVRAIGEVRRMSDGVLLAQAEGFVGEDEPTWYGGMMRKWKWGQAKGEKIWYEEEVQKRPDYAIRAMAQTRAISRACRSAFAHVVVMMDAGLSTTPAEEVPIGWFDDGNVIDAAPVETHDRRRPAARQKLDGEHTSATALKKAVTEMVNEVRAATSERRINAIMRLGKETVKQAERDYPALLDGEDDVPEDTGLKGAVADRRKVLRDSRATVFIEQARQEADSVEALGVWYTKHEERIAELMDIDRDIFDKEHQAFESELEQKGQAA